MDGDGGALRQDELRADAALLREYGSTVPDSWVGVRLEDTTLVAYVTDPDAHRAAVLALVGHPNAIEFRAAPYPRTHLDRVHREMRELLERWPGGSYGGGVGTTAVHVRLGGGFDDLAGHLLDRFGDAVEVTVGGHRFPVDTSGVVAPRAVPTSTTTLAHARLDVLPDETSLATPAQLRGIVRVTNRSDDDPLTFVTGQPLVGDVLDRDRTAVVGVFNGAIRGTGLRVSLAPGSSTDIGFVAGTDTVDPRLGTALPPGSYSLVVRVPVHDDGGTRQVVTPAVDVDLVAP